MTLIGVGGGGLLTGVAGARARVRVCACVCACVCVCVCCVGFEFGKVAGATASSYRLHILSVVQAHLDDHLEGTLHVNNPGV